MVVPWGMLANPVLNTVSGTSSGISSRGPKAPFRRRGVIPRGSLKRVEGDCHCQGRAPEQVVC
eukprot:1596433-Prorocentrum_lima.AAC.1